MPCSWESKAIHIFEMNEVMCWEVMALCNILEQRSSLGELSPNSTAGCLNSLCHSRLVEAHEYVAEWCGSVLGGGFSVLGDTVKLLYIEIGLIPSSKPAMLLPVVTKHNQ